MGLESMRKYYFKWSKPGAPALRSRGPRSPRYLTQSLTRTTPRNCKRIATLPNCQGKYIACKIRCFCQLFLKIKFFLKLIMIINKDHHVNLRGYPMWTKVVKVGHWNVTYKTVRSRSKKQVMFRICSQKDTLYLLFANIRTLCQT